MLQIISANLITSLSSAATAACRRQLRAVVTPLRALVPRSLRYGMTTTTAAAARARRGKRWN
ncbi:MAG: hypothetical protein LBH84_05875 [Prevotellaceae bacterium]|nr:hypothetical protein [Prevotellaceae bacterium]